MPDPARIEQIADYLYSQAEDLRCNTFYPSWSAIAWLKDSAAFLRTLAAPGSVSAAADEPTRGGLIYTPTKRVMGVDAPDLGEPIGDAAADEPGEQ